MLLSVMLKDPDTKLNPDGAAQIVIQSDARDHFSKGEKGTESAETLVFQFLFLAAQHFYSVFQLINFYKLFPCWLNGKIPPVSTFKVATLLTASYMSPH